VAGPTAPDFQLVRIVREFLLASRLLLRVARRFRSGELTWAEVQELVGNDEASSLFRLKESTHALFRPRRGGAPAMCREALFDLAVGSLFHEAMKFRENFYQRAIYGPRVRALRQRGGIGADDLFREFERILAASLMRVEEALQEMETIFVQTRDECRALMRAHGGSGLLARFLVGHAGEVAEVFEEEIDLLLGAIHGSAAAAYLLAARSNLDSGFFGEALPCLDAAAERGVAESEIGPLRFFAAGMQAYLEARYGDALEGVEAWLDRVGTEGIESHRALARSALSRLDQLVCGPEAPDLLRRARVLTERLASPDATDAVDRARPGETSRRIRSGRPAG